MTAESLEEIRDQLFALYPQMNSATMGELLATALTSANLAGRAEVADGD